MSENLNPNEQQSLLTQLRQAFDQDDLQKMCATAAQEEEGRRERDERANFLDSPAADDYGYDNLGRSYSRAMSQAEAHKQKRDAAYSKVLEKTQARVRLFDEILNQALDRALVSQLEQLKAEIAVASEGTPRECTKWWESQGQTWVDKLSLVTIN